MRNLILVATLALLGLLSLSVGPMELTHLFYFRDHSPESLVFWDIRIPRTMAAIWVGSSLGLGGALLQTLLRNPLAEPYTLGLSGAASLGATTALILKLTPISFFMPLLATGFCLATAFIVLSLAVKVKHSRNLILIGVMLSLFFGSVVVLLMTLLKPQELQTLLFWMMGQVGTERDQDWYYCALVFIFVFAWAMFKLRDLDRLLLGECVAQSLGTNVKSLGLQMVFLVSVLVAVSVSVSGLIGFVGLLAPHLTKLLFRTHRHLQFLVGTAITGAILLLGADILARYLGGDRELPTGGLVALLGAPLLIYLIHQRSGYDSN